MRLDFIVTVPRSNAVFTAMGESVQAESGKRNDSAGDRVRTIDPARELVIGLVQQTVTRKTSDRARQN